MQTAAHRFKLVYHFFFSFQLNLFRTERFAREELDDVSENFLYE